MVLVQLCLCERRGTRHGGGEQKRLPLVLEEIEHLPGGMGAKIKAPKGGKKYKSNKKEGIL